MTTLDWILLGSLVIAFGVGANILSRILKLVSWIPLVKLVIRLVGGGVAVLATTVLIGSVIAPNVAPVANSTVGAWLVLVSDLLWLNW